MSSKGSLDRTSTAGKNREAVGPRRGALHRREDHTSCKRQYQVACLLILCIQEDGKEVMFSVTIQSGIKMRVTFRHGVLRKPCASSNYIFGMHGRKCSD